MLDGSRFGPRLAPTHLALAFVAVVYIPIALGRPADVFWSPDQGDKLLQVHALLEGRHDLSIAYPGLWLDPELQYRPYLISYVWNNTIQVPWPLAWALPSALLYAVFGGTGLVLLPVVGGLLAAWAAGRLAERMAPGSGWLAVLLSALATPMLVFSTLFWEHAPAAGLFTLGFLLLPLQGPGSVRSSLKSLLAGICFGLAIAWRNEIAMYLVAALAAAWLASTGWRSRRELAWLPFGLALVLLPAAVSNWLVAGSVYPRTPALPVSLERVVSNLALVSPRLVPDFLVGREFGMQMPELIRWSPAAGLVLLGLAHVPSAGRAQALLRAGGLALSGLATAALFVTPAPLAVGGFLIAAPFLAVVLLAPRGLAATPTGKTLVIFAAMALLMYAAAVGLLHSRGFNEPGLQWGPRYLLPIYPLLAAPAAVTLRHLLVYRKLDRVLGRSLAALAVAFQLVGLEKIDMRQLLVQQNAALVASLPAGLVVSGRFYLVEPAPGLNRERAVFCVQTAAALRGWLDRALAAGETQFWFVDSEPLPARWLENAAPPALAEARGGSLLAVRYDSRALQRTLRADGSPDASCGYELRR